MVVPLGGGGKSCSLEVRAVPGPMRRRRCSHTAGRPAPDDEADGGPAAPPGRGLAAALRAGLSCWPAEARAGGRGAAVTVLEDDEEWNAAAARP